MNKLVLGLIIAEVFKTDSIFARAAVVLAIQEKTLETECAKKQLDIME